jgi:hypothetical protein
MRNLASKLKRYYNPKLFLILIFIAAVVVRWWYLPNKNINFGYDQARDAFAIREILGGHLKILGPPTSGTPGLFHGVLYYYVVTPAYFFGNGNPLVVAYWMSLISALVVFPVFYLTYLLTKKNTPAIIAALIFAFSFDAIQFSDFLSNVSLGILFVPFIYIGIFLWVNKLSKWAPLITGLAFGMAVQSEIAFYYYLVPILFWLLIFKKKIDRKEVIIFVVSFIMAISTMIVSEVKFGFPGLRGLIYLFSSQDATARNKQLSDFFITFVNQVGNRFADTIYPFNIAFGGLIGLAMVAGSFIKKIGGRRGSILTWQIFLITYIFAHIIALPFGGSITPYIMIGAIPAIAVFVAIFLWKFLKGNSIVLATAVLLLLSLNLVKFVKQSNSATPDYFTGDYLLSTEIKMVDYTYKESGMKPFSISSLTSPLHINTLWSYLYNWYGQSTYGYLPYWVGPDQVGQPGNNLQSPPKNLKEHFFIMEPTYEIPSLWVDYAKGDQDSMSSLVDQKSFGNFIVQEREMKISGNKTSIK